jgi:asparagine synthase (glutamine-hydrolysing)
MSAIAGCMAVPRGGFTIREPYLSAMRDAMAHRGPDGYGAWISPDGDVGLAHRRLSATDGPGRGPSGRDPGFPASQPWSNAEGTLRIALDGGIHNHAEIRLCLERTGKYRWHAVPSEAETALYAFAEWGIGCLSRFRGAFSFALWDARTRELWLARDRLGVKPLFYSRHHGRFAFASEIKALLADPEQPRSVDAEAFFHSLSFLAAPGASTLFAGIRKLPPGTWLRLGADGATQEHRYWDAWDDVAPLAGASEAEVASLLIGALRDAVRLQTAGVASPGVFLSGGIDSGALAVLLGEGTRALAFTLGYAGDMGGYSPEMEPAGRMARIAGLGHQQRLIASEALLRYLPRMIRSQDEPIGDPICAQLRFLAGLARGQGLSTCQLGEGADELLGGSPLRSRMRQLQGWDRYPMPKTCRRLALAGLSLAGKAERNSAEWIKRGIAGIPMDWGAADEFNQAEKTALLSLRLRRELSGLTSWEPLAPIRHRYEGKAWEKSPANWAAYLELSLGLPELQLMRIDRMCMGAGLEARMPFLDHKFVELALGVPSAMKTKGGQLKYILKKSLRGLLPDEVLDRSKREFGVPVPTWIRAGLGRVMETELHRFCRETDILDWDGVRRCLAKSAGFQAWHLYNLAVWHRTHIEGR